MPRMPDDLCRAHAAAHASYLALCKAVAYAAVREPGALPDLMESLSARYTERTALELLIASYDDQLSLLDDLTH